MSDADGARIDRRSLGRLRGPSALVQKSRQQVADHTLLPNPPKSSLEPSPQTQEELLGSLYDTDDCHCEGGDGDGVDHVVESL